jgi:hypothetical protein
MCGGMQVSSQRPAHICSLPRWMCSSDSLMARRNRGSLIKEKLIRAGKNLGGCAEQYGSQSFVLGKPNGYT